MENQSTTTTPAFAFQVQLAHRHLTSDNISQVCLCNILYMPPGIMSTTRRQKTTWRLLQCQALQLPKKKNKKKQLYLRELNLRTSPSQENRPWADDCRPIKAHERLANFFRSFPTSMWLHSIMVHSSAKSRPHPCLHLVWAIYQSQEKNEKYVSSYDLWVAQHRENIVLSVPDFWDTLHHLPAASWINLSPKQAEWP